MFERYTEQCKKAVFFAQQTALRGGAPAIDSGHLLLGLLTEPQTRADTIFQLRELFPEETARQNNLPKEPLVKGRIPLTDDGKRSLAYTEREASNLRDYWIDTEHLVLGLLREETSTAAAKLRGVGLHTDGCRHLVIEGKGSRPPRPDPVLWWVRRHPLGITLQIVFLLGVIAALILLGSGGAR